ncbi:MAG TPA: hypothetical protein GX012_02200 [Acholeplasma sp.]|nr:hypothetical protein [Acholeplasma sp.]
MEFLIFIIIVLIVIGVLFLRSPKGRGMIGEYQVRRALGNNVEGLKYVINDVTIVNNGKSSQIDHIVILRTGIFVIETKNYSGSIYGSETSRNWTQVLAYGKVKNKFYNPIMQNKSHIYALSELLGRKNIFKSVIVFPKAKLHLNVGTPVVNIRLLRKELTSYNKAILTSQEIENFYNVIMYYKENPPVTNKEHVASIKEMKQKIEDNICPRCNSKLILRAGVQGRLYSCSNYPTCTFRKSI